MKSRSLSISRVALGASKNEVIRELGQPVSESESPMHTKALELVNGVCVALEYEDGLIAVFAPQVMAADSRACEIEGTTLEENGLPILKCGDSKEQVLRKLGPPLNASHLQGTASLEYELADGVLTVDIVGEQVQGFNLSSRRLYAAGT